MLRAWTAGLAGCMLAPAAQAVGLDGGTLPLAYGLPFLALLLGMALLPLCAARLWHRHDSRFVLLCVAALLLPMVGQLGLATTWRSVLHVLLAEYLPFVVLLATLYTVAGGIHFAGQLRGSPALNTGLLALGTVLASLMGTTGAAMLLIRPLIRANETRRQSKHVFVFFIFLVANAGGALTPLGDPPLFLGFLKGVSFDWMLGHILSQTAFVVCSLLALFWLIDSCSYRRQRRLAFEPSVAQPDWAWAIHGRVNFLLLLAVLALVLMSGLWHPGVALELAGTALGWSALLRDLGLLLVLALSLHWTPASVRQANRFSWRPMREVALLFAGIFVTMMPVMAMLGAGSHGPLAGWVAGLADAHGQPSALSYFWASGLLSGFLDNAPTYLVFFNLAGGDAQVLMTRLAPILAAISTGAVFMGALSYIGNAPNMMVKAVVEERGLAMPSFFAYLLWSGAVLLPVLGVMSLLWWG
jgi:Na+/H+ antiporter NhaD/arsenite permease-like protein